MNIKVCHCYIMSDIYYILCIYEHEIYYVQGL